jgi:arylformamidase
MMKSGYIDISWPITNDMTAYKDRNIVRIAPTKEFAQDSTRESLITLGSHTGTHIDAPAHFIEHGDTVDQIFFMHLIGSCRLIDVSTCTDKITAHDLEKHNVQMHEIILLKTLNSAQAVTANFEPNFIYLSADAAEFLAQKKIKTAGIDYLGIERNQPGHETHQKLLSAGIVIIEGLRLEHIEAGSYNLICLPLLLPGLDAAPARAILEKI